MKSLILIAVMSCAFAGHASSEIVDGVTWTYSVSNGKASVYKGTGSPAIPVAAKGALTIPAMLGGCPVTSIGDFAFYNCGGLTSVTIPSSVTSIGDDAFSGCSGLTAVTIPSDVTSIGSGAFYNCSGLTSVMIPESVTSIGDIAFSGCGGLADKDGFVIVRDVLYDYAGKASTVTIPTNVTSIGHSAFLGRKGLASVTILSSVTNIGSFAFYGCSGLTSITIRDGVKSIGESAFWDCGGLSSVVIPTSVTSIGGSAFRGCGGLAKLTLPFVGRKRGNSGTDASLFGYIFGTSSYTGSTATTQYYQSSSGTTYYIPNSLKTVVITDETAIGYGAFDNCSRLTSVTIPTSVTSIGDRAFRGCSGLASVTIPSGVVSIGEWAFLDCTGLTSITIPTSVTNIGSAAFSGCSGLTSIALPFVGSKRGNSGKTESLFGYVFGETSYTGARGATQYYKSHSYKTYFLPASLKTIVITDETTIGYGAFYGCSGLTSITIPSSVTSIGDYAFSHCGELTSVTIPSSVMSIGDFAFGYCRGLTAVTISDGVTSVGGYAFYECGELTSVMIPSSVTGIGSYAFSDCDGLTSLTISEGVTSIGEWAFHGCRGLTSVTIPSSVTNIGEWAFLDCSGLTSVTIPPCVTRLSTTFPSTYQTISNVVIHGGATSISDRMFSGCSGLVSVKIPSSVTRIGDYAFYNCVGLTSIVIPSGVTYIGDYAFYNCTGIESVTIPSSGIRIGNSAFGNCRMLTSIRIPESVMSIGEGAFAGCDGLGLELQQGFVIVDGCILSFNGECPECLVIPEGVRSIAGGVFRDCYGLVSVTLPVSLKCISENAFNGCTSIECLELPEGLESVEDGAFRDCTWIQEVAFPSSLTNIGKMAFANCSMLDGVECFDGLQSVGEGAFSNCWRMLSVALPVTVDEIGERAFYNCKNVLGVMVPAHVDTLAQLFPDVYQTLQSVVIADGETELTAGVFKGCALLEEVELSDAIREIPDSTFEGCSEMRRIKFPDELIRIGNRAFYGCGQIWQLDFPSGLKEIGSDAFNGLQQVRDLECPPAVTNIGARAFKGVWDDVEVKLPEALQSLGADAFADCSSIRKVSLPVVKTPIKAAFSAAYSQIESVKILGAPDVIHNEFCRDVVQLSAIQIPASVTQIGDYAFSGLTNLAAIELPPNLCTIGEYAFNGDSRLTAVALPQSVEAVGYRAFYGCSNIRVVGCPGELDTLYTLFPSAYSKITTVSINEGTTRLMNGLLSGCTKLSDVDLPSGVVAIGASAFKGCTALAAFGVPNGVVALGDDVFYGCTGLTALSLPEGLENIPSGAFQNCRAISSLVIPASVDYIGANAFSGCTALKSVSYLGSCPQFDSACYSGTPSDLSSYVVFGSRGWDGIPTSRTLPESWPTANARAITYWEPNTFDATFDGNGGTPSSSVVVQTTGMTYVLPEENPEMLGARFDGWWTQPVNGGRIKSTTKVEVTRAQTFYAHWKYNGYSVRFDANGGIGEMEGQVMTVNTPVELAPNRYLRKGYRFEGWALSADGEVTFADGEEVENLSFEHNAVIPLYAVWAEQPWDAADYLNASGRAFAFGGDAEWVADDEVSHDGIGSMRSGVIAAADEGKKTVSVMQTTVVGTGSGSFWWKVDCEPADGSDYFDYCAFSVDGTEVAKIAGTEDWGKVDYVVTGEGEHVLKWVFTRDDWDEDESLYENAAWVDEFEWAPTPVTLSFDAGGADGEVPASVTKYAGYEMPLPSPSMLTKDGMAFVGWSDGVSVFRSGDAYTFGSVDAVLCAVWEEKTWTLEEAANLTGLTIVTGGDANWNVDLDKNYDGVASIRSGVIGDDQQTWVSIDVEGAGTVAFRTFVSGEFSRGKKCDYLKFEVDGAEEFSSHDAAWSNVVVKVSGRGTHTLKWTYLKNASKSAGNDCAWLDQIVWEPDAETEVVPTIAELADVFGEESDVVKGVKDEAQLTAFNQFLKDCAIASASDMSAGQKTWAYQSFKLSEVLTAPQLFEEEPVLKFDDIELNGGNLALTVSLHAGAEAITLAKDKLAEKIRVGTSLDAIVEMPQIIASPSTDGTSLTFTVAPPEGDKGFVRILIN